MIYKDGKPALLYKAISSSEITDKLLSGLPLKPVILPPKMYDDAEAAGIDMRGYIKSAPIPTN